MIYVKAINGLYRVWREGQEARPFTYRRDAVEAARLEAQPGEEIDDAIVSNLPVLLIRSLLDRLGARLFVETGTAWGDTAELAAPLVDRLWTIEKSEAQYRAARKRLRPYPRVACLRGDSAECLAKLIEDGLLAEPFVAWHDAHYSGGGTAGADDECPLLRELAALAPVRCPCALVIDDARLFSGTVETPHPEHWPTVAQIEAAVPWPSVTFEVVGDQIVIVKE